MKHSRFGLILFLTSGSLLACNGDPTSSIRDDGPQRVIADPNVVFLDKGAATFVTLQLVDAQGNQLPTTFDATSQNALVTVVRDTTFLATTNGADLNTTERFTVTGVDYVSTAISVTAGSDTLTIPVHVVPKTTIAATFSNLTPALGETVTITAPPGVTFSPTSTVNFGAAALLPVEVVVAADGSSISFVPPPNLTAAPAQITDVVSVGSSDLTFTNTTADGLTTPEVVDLPGTVAPSFTPAANQTVTVTLSGATSTAPTDTAAVPVLIGQTPAVLLSRTPTTVTFLPAPGAIGPVTLAGVFLDAIPQFELTLSTPDTMTVGTVIPTMAGTGSAATAPTLTIPAVGGTVAFYDGAPMAAAVCGDESGFPCQLYKFTLADSTVLSADLTWTGSPADLGLYIMDSGVSDTGESCDAGGRASAPAEEACDLTLGAGTYYAAVISFGPGYPENDPNPTSIFLSLTPQAPAGP